MAAPVADVLTRVSEINQRIGFLLVELLNTPRGNEQAARLHELGQHLGSLSAECMARAAEVNGSETPSRVIIDAAD